MFGFFIVIFIGLLIIIWRLLAVKELALAAAKKHCQSMNVQFLDGSVVQTGIRLSLNKKNYPVVQQKYEFEFSTNGERRYKGWISMTGKRLTGAELQAHTFPEQNLH